MCEPYGSAAGYADLHRTYTDQPRAYGINIPETICRSLHPFPFPAPNPNLANRTPIVL